MDADAVSNLEPTASPETAGYKLQILTRWPSDQSKSSPVDWSAALGSGRLAIVNDPLDEAKTGASITIP
ncbi:hypothetical protein [Mesorhizobium sp. LjNodule214]|uniref:hypothetical protein n=1 Tax=Mesorhizobium sp. LjNodule214 TaxID=3342252 RepID=UPI003ECE7F8E